MKIINKLPLIFLILGTIWLRIANLGYSDYQGDEIKALLIPDSGQSVSGFLFEQRKGPIQFLITYALGFIDPTFMNQFLFRLPFAVAGIAAVYFFFKLVELYFDKKLALYATMFFSFNGLLVAFSRLVQYQSVTILFYILAAYLFSLTIKKTGWEIKGWYLGAIFWALSILSHFDGGFIGIFVVYIAYIWFKQTALPKNVKLKHLVFSGLLFIFILGLFFGPYVLEISQATKAYWLNRVTDTSAKISSSIVTYKVYNPMYIFYAFTGLVILSLLKFKQSWPILLWTAFPLFVWEVITDIPGTHIYNYLIPMFILAAFGLRVLEEVSQKILKIVSSYLNLVVLSVLFIFMFYLSHVVFVDHTFEYPWEDEPFLFRELKKPNPIFHLSLFGFPYNRGWEEIGKYVLAENNGHYSTNERDSISRFYVPIPKDTTEAGHYLTIKNPQSFAGDFLQEKAKYWGSKYEPEKVIYNADGEIVAEIYVMPKGSLEAIKLEGY